MNPKDELSSKTRSEIASTFGEFNQSKKQANRLKALQFSVINDINSLIEDDESIELENLDFVNNETKATDKIQTVGINSITVINDNDSENYSLSELDVETLIKILQQIEEFRLDKYQNYPGCCTEFFESGDHWNSHEVNWGGFVPCLKHKDLSLEQITELIGRNPVTDENVYLFIRTPEPREIYEENYKNCSIEIADNLDGTFTAYCRIIDEEGDWIDSIGESSQSYFTKEEALKSAKKIVDDYENNLENNEH